MSLTGAPRIISLVPSWTETLIEAGANVVGRTRFCIHPESKVGGIEIVGGTKNIDLEKIRKLSPDFILLDREENTKEMAEQLANVATLHVSHVKAVSEMPAELRRLAKAISMTELNEYARRFEVATSEAPVLHNDSTFVYCIWKNPWMAVGRETFIASMLERAGWRMDRLWPDTNEKYPKFKIEEVPDDAVILLSSEPYPFATKPPTEFGERKQILVDAERYSWFGFRSLKFLESLNRKPS